MIRESTLWSDGLGEEEYTEMVCEPKWCIRCVREKLTHPFSGRERRNTYIKRKEEGVRRLEVKRQIVINGRGVYKALFLMLAPSWELFEGVKHCRQDIIHCGIIGPRYFPWSRQIFDRPPHAPSPKVENENKKGGGLTLPCWGRRGRWCRNKR